MLPILTNALLKEGSFWAAEIIQQMGAAGLPAIEALEKAYSATSNDSAQLYAYEAIRALDRTRALDPSVVVEALESKNPTSRMHAARLLWEDYRNAEQVLPTLTQLVASRDSGGLPAPQAFAALKILNEIGPPAEPALPIIREILESRTGNSGVWIAATNAWLKIAPHLPIPSKRES